MSVVPFRGVLVRRRYTAVGVKPWRQRAERVYENLVCEKSRIASPAGWQKNSVTVVTGAAQSDPLLSGHCRRVLQLGWCRSALHYNDTFTVEPDKNQAVFGALTSLRHCTMNVEYPQPLLWC